MLDSSPAVSAVKASGGESVFVGNEVYVNRIPEVPCEGRMLREAEGGLDQVSYKPTALEQRYRYPLLEDKADSGLNFDLVDVMSWESPWVRLESIMPPAKRKKHPDTDSGQQASSSSYYQHYQKKHKGDISANAIAAAKHGRVAAADLTLPYELQLRSIPKAHQVPLYQRDVVASSTSATSVPSISAVPWLKRTEYITAKDERSLALTSALVSESMEQLIEIEQRQASFSLSDSSSSNTTMSHTNTMDVDGAEDDTRDDADRLVDSILGDSSKSSRSPGPGASRQATASPGSSKSAPKTSLQSPFVVDAAKVLRSIERSFQAVASRTSIVHPSEILQRKRSGDNNALRRSSGAGLNSSGGISKASDGPHVVEEWDIFPNELIWPNEYLAVQSDNPLPPGELALVPLHLHDPTLLKPSHTESEYKAAHDAHLVSQKKKELLSLYAKPTTNPDGSLATGAVDPQNLAADELAFHSHWEAEALSLRPGFDTMGSYVFSVGPTVPYDADEDEESGVIFEGDTHAETSAARRRKNQSLSRAKIGTATFKNVEAHLQLKPPSAEGRSLASSKHTPDTVKLVPSDIPVLEMHLRNIASNTLRE